MQASPAHRRTILLSLAIVMVQVAAAIYFVVDGIGDWVEQAGRGLSAEIALECLVALALFVSIVLGARQLREALAAARRYEAALSVARGAMQDLLARRFAEWQLSPSQADVAIFAMKGCNTREIARMRNAAESTVRSQLSQVYSKAGVNSQAMLMALFLEDLV